MLFENSTQDLVRVTNLLHYFGERVHAQPKCFNFDQKLNNHQSIISCDKKSMRSCWSNNTSTDSLVMKNIICFLLLRWKWNARRLIRSSLCKKNLQCFQNCILLHSNKQRKYIATNLIILKHRRFSRKVLRKVTASVVFIHK